MSDNGINIKNLIQTVTEEVLQKLKADATQSQGTLAVLPSYVFDQAGVVRYLKGKSGSVTCTMFEKAYLNCDGFIQKRIETTEDKRKLATELNKYKDIVIVTPPLSLIKAVANGDDSMYEAMLCIRPMLWGKEVTVLLDFETQKYNHSNALASLVDDIQMLEKAGFKVVQIKQKNIQSEIKDLVTEEDIREAHKNGVLSIRVKKGAIVTQLADERAKEIGILIEY